MVRTQILLPPQLLEWLRAEAKKHGISVSELIRRLLDEAKGKP
jgi:hypothetical protein